MFSLLVLSLALSTPSAATRAVVPADPEPQIVVVQPEQPQIKVELPAPQFDAMEIQPDSDICYKIRAYIFSKGPNPKLLRETTCGPKRPVAKDADGAQPKLVPLNVMDKPTAAPQK